MMFTACHAGGLRTLHCRAVAHLWCGSGAALHADSCCAADGPSGLVKMTLPTAYTTAVLAWGLLTFPQGYKTAGSVAANVDEVRWGANYLLAAVGGETAPYLLSQVGFMSRTTSGPMAPVTPASTSLVLAVCISEKASVDEVRWGTNYLLVDVGGETAPYLLSPASMRSSLRPCCPTMHRCSAGPCSG